MRSWKTWLGIVLSCVFFFLAASKLDWPRFLESLAHVNPLLILAVMATVMGTLLIRGYRWSFFLKLIARVPAIDLFWSTTIGFAVNNILPARLGEIVGAYSLHRRRDVPFGSAFGTIVVERLWDTFVALFLFVIALAVFDFPNLQEIFKLGGTHGGGVTQGRIALVLGTGGCVLLAGILLLKWKTELFLRIAGVFLKPLPERYSMKVIGLFRSFIQGLTQTKKPAEIAWVFFISVAIWIISGFSVYMNVLAFGISLSFKAVIVLLVAIIAAVAIPAAPGYMGVYHYLAQQALVLYVGMDPTQAFSIAVVIHASNYIPQTLVGLARFAYEGISISDLKSVKIK